MRTIIAGSRCACSMQELEAAIRKCGWQISTVISGTAKGADRLGEEWARRNGIPLEQYPADWDNHGKAAGYIRNECMADVAEALIALWDGESNGTRHMIRLAQLRVMRVHVEMVL